MGTIMLVGAGIFIGWLLFRPRNSHQVIQRGQFRPDDARMAEQGRNVERGHDTVQPYPANMQEHPNKSSNTLRNVAGGMVAGAVLGHMLTDDHRAEAHQTTNNYNMDNNYYDYDELNRENVDEDGDYAGDYDYAGEDYDSDDYSSYDDAYDSDYDDDSSDWDTDSYDDGGDW